MRRNLLGPKGPYQEQYEQAVLRAQKRAQAIARPQLPESFPLCYDPAFAGSPRSHRWPVRGYFQPKSTTPRLFGDQVGEAVLLTLLTLTQTTDRLPAWWDELKTNTGRRFELTTDYRKFCELYELEDSLTTYCRWLSTPGNAWNALTGSSLSVATTRNAQQLAHWATRVGPVLYRAPLLPTVISRTARFDRETFWHYVLLGLTKTNPHMWAVYVPPAVGVSANRVGLYHVPHADIVTALSIPVGDGPYCLRLNKKL